MPNSASKLGTLYIVATPIGHPDDISARAVRALNEADWVVCEEVREGGRLLKRHHITKLLVDLNEHNEKTRTPELVAELQRGKSLALICDAGTPVFYDPGQALVGEAYKLGAKVVVVPGASSLMAALVVSGLPINQFRFLGMLPPKHEARRKALKVLQKETTTAIMLDAPYRLHAVLEDIVTVLGKERSIVVACDLTMPTEQVVRGAAFQVSEHFRLRPFKGEYVVLVAGIK
jgi:16S rRNA (cytidine1402-2'-O)-methyltransferase